VDENYCFVCKNLIDKIPVSYITLIKGEQKPTVYTFCSSGCAIPFIKGFEHGVSLVRKEMERDVQTKSN